MTMDRRRFLWTAAGAAASAAGLGIATPVVPAFAGGAHAHDPQPELAPASVTIRSREVTGPLPHIWEECVGSDRAAITLRESWRRDIELARAELGVKRVRFHGILNDELGVLTRTTQRGSGTANFRNVAAVYDGLVARGLAPLVELGFMPSELASGARTFGFYKGNVTPPKSLEAWGGFIREFVTFLVQRYGLATVAQWPLEVWNEPNLGYAFWSGTQADYFQLYKAAAVAVKEVSPQLRVGGPATSSTAWLPEFLAFCAQERAPVDFVSTHVYAGDKQSTLFGPGVELSINDVVPEAVRRARRTVSASAFPTLPLYLDEWSSDSPAMIAHVLANVVGHVDMMSHWVLSGTYEELGPVDYVLAEGAMGWALIVDGIRRPSYNTYRLLRALGDRRLAADGPALASRRADGTFAALVWNLAEVVQPGGIPGANPKRDIVGSAKRVAVSIPDMRPGQPLLVRYVDQVRGSPLPAFRAMGAPKVPTLAQLAVLRRASERIPAERLRLGTDRTVTLELPPEGVALIETV